MGFCLSLEKGYIYTHGNVGKLGGRRGREWQGVYVIFSKVNGDSTARAGHGSSRDIRTWWSMWVSSLQYLLYADMISFLVIFPRYLPAIVDP